jgi:hypothetical protein
MPLPIKRRLPAGTAPASCCGCGHRINAFTYVTPGVRLPQCRRCAVARCVKLGTPANLIPERFR